MTHQNKIARKPYPTDLSDGQWKLLGPFIPRALGTARAGGRTRTTDMREVLNALFYLLRTGCSWRMLPHDFPDYRIVRHYFDSWKKSGVWKHIHDALRGKVREKARRTKEPTAGIIDSQSVKTAEKGGFVAMMLAKR
jgi:putative transposase